MKVDQTIPSISLSLISPAKANPRGAIAKSDIAELIESVKASGIITPLIVRPVNEHFEIIAGHRRYHAGLFSGARRSAQA